MAKTILYLVRHGRTMGNERGRFSGRTPEPLTEKGREQARRAAAMLAGRNISVIYASPMARTMETAGIIGDITGIPVIEEPGLAEIRIPQWDGRLKEDLRYDPASRYDLWARDPAGFCLADAERLEDVQKRAVAAVSSIIEQHSGEEIAAVSHLAVIRCILLYCSNRPLADYRNIEVKNATPLALIMEDDHCYVDRKSASV